MIYLKNKEELKKMRLAANAVKEVLENLIENTKEGVSTWELNKIAENIAEKRSFIAAFKGYSNYPASVCFALNDEVVHGIPSKEKILMDGDILGIDFGACVDGYYGDSAITVPVGNIPSMTKKLLEVTEASLFKGIDNAKPKNRIKDISKSIQDFVEENGFSVVKSFVGHGIGKNLHEEPQVPNFVTEMSQLGVSLKSGMVLAIEPMVNIGTADVKILNDGWTAVTADGKLSAHFEHTVAITDNGPEVLTRLN
ncbi:MAG: type I methionyl aminopeptidase [Thermodesulfobacteriota bacterium]